MTKALQDSVQMLYNSHIKKQVAHFYTALIANNEIATPNPVN
jgi:hypothetical protein